MNLIMIGAYGLVLFTGVYLWAWLEEKRDLKREHEGVRGFAAQKTASDPLNKVSTLQSH
jgi:hypothetical protein